MSFGGGSKSSSTTNTTTVDTTISTVDNRVGEHGAAIGGNVQVNPGDINGSLTISTTDQGAIKGGVDLALESLHGIETSSANALSAVTSTTSDTIKQAFGLANEARQSETSAALNNFLKYGVWVAIAGIAAYVIVKRGKV